MISFADFGLAPSVVETLRLHGIKEATPVQERAIPEVRAGRDVIVQAQTGTGKTLAFLLPIFEKIKAQADVAQALVVTPTRELAIQIAKVAGRLGEAAGITSLKSPLPLASRSDETSSAGTAREICAVTPIELEELGADSTVTSSLSGFDPSSVTS